MAKCICVCGHAAYMHFLRGPSSACGDHSCQCRKYDEIKAKKEPDMTLTDAQRETIRRFGLADSERAERYRKACEMVVADWDRVSQPGAACEDVPDPDYVAACRAALQEPTHATER